MRRARAGQTFPPCLLCSVWLCHLLVSLFQSQPMGAILLQADVRESRPRGMFPSGKDGENLRPGPMLTGDIFQYLGSHEAQKAMECQK